MLRFPRALLDRPLNPDERLQRETEDLRFQRPECRELLKKIKPRDRGGRRLGRLDGGSAGSANLASK